MAQTYSQSLTGINAGARYAAKVISVGDADAASNAFPALASGVGAQQGNMSRGNQILCKNADGSQSWYTIDAERSIPGVQLIMRPV